jgi:tetratricopeptide (TPR) repeat protein
LELLGQPDRALANYERAVALSPANAYNHNVLGRCYRKRGDEKRALEHLERAQILNHWSDVSTELNLIEMKHPEPAPEPPR